MEDVFRGKLLSTVPVLGNSLSQAVYGCSTE